MFVHEIRAFNVDESDVSTSRQKGRSGTWPAMIDGDNSVCWYFYSMYFKNNEMFLVLTSKDF